MQMTDKIEMLLTLRLKSIAERGEQITNVAKAMEESGHIDEMGLKSVMDGLNAIQDDWVALNDIYQAFHKFEIPEKETK